MKLYLSLLVAMFMFVIPVFSQDIITKRNGDEISCKVLEVSTEIISYSIAVPGDSSLPEVLKINKSDVFMIRYQNGSKDVFEIKSEVDYVKPPVKEELVPQVSDKIEVDGRKYYYHNRKIGRSRVVGIVRRENNKEINKLVTKSIICSVFSPILKFATIPFGVVGISVLAVNSGANVDLEPSERSLAAVGIGTLILGQAGGYTLDYFQSKNLKAAIELYNQKHP